MTEALLYEGKAKKVFTTDDADVLLHRYKDDATAFNAKKRGSWEGKGRTNATMASGKAQQMRVKAPAQGASQSVW